MKKGLGFLAAVVAMIAESEINLMNRTSQGYEPEKPKEPKDNIPDGCEKYYFDKYGNCIDGPETAVYECVARNYKNAQRKYQNWKNNQ